MILPAGKTELRTHWKVVAAAAVGAGAGITGMSVYSLSILIDPLSDAFGWSRAEVSAAKSVLTAGFVMTGPIIGYLADKVGVRRIGMISLASLSLAMFAMTQIGPSIISFYAFLLMLSFAGAGTTPLVWTRAVASCFKEGRGLALALTLVGPGIVGVFTPELLDTLIARFDWRAAYIAMGLFAALALIPVSLFFFEGSIVAKSDAPAAPHSGVTVIEAIRGRHFWQIGFGFLLVGAVISALMVHLVPLITDAGIPRNIAVRTAGVLGMAVIFGRLLTGYLVDRIHPPYVAGLFLFMPVIGCLIVITGPVSAAVMVFVVLCIGLAAGSEVDLIPFLTARYFGLKSWGKIYGWMFAAFYTGVGFGPPFFGLMHDIYGSYDLAIMCAIPLLSLGVLAVATLGRPQTMS